MKKAALVTKSLLKGVFLKTMQDVIENDDGTEATQKTHSALSNEVDAYLIETPSKIPKVGKKLSEADKEALDSCFAPIIQRSVEKIYIS
jgi:nucleosome binding factor SPN SPT16 subunit